MPKKKGEEVALPRRRRESMWTWERKFDPVTINNGSINLSERKGEMMRKMLLTVSIFVGLVMLLASGPMVTSASAGTLPLTVTNVDVKAGNNGQTPVCRSNNTGNEVKVSADISATFTQPSDSGYINGSCADKKCSGETGSGKSCSERTDTKTTVTVNSAGLTVTANASSLSGTNPGTFSGTLPTGPEGENTVTVNAAASENFTTNTYEKKYTWGSVGSPNTSCDGTNLGNEILKTTRTVSNTGAASGSFNYQVDLVGPTAADVNNFGNNPPSIFQTHKENFVGQITEGSPDTGWTLDVTATGPGSATIIGETSGNFNPNGVGNISPFGLQTSCDTPVGDYTVAATLKTVDRCGASWDDIYLTGDDFTVNGTTLVLVPQTLVLSQLPGRYGIDECFVNSIKRQKTKLIVNNTPGSVHIGATVESVIRGNGGSCDVPGYVENGMLTLTLPEPVNNAGFWYTETGNSPSSGSSPPAHIFVGKINTENSEVLDYHSGWPLVEVTDLVTQVTNGQTITIDLSGLGQIPVGDTIYARAHARFYADSVDDQPLDTPFMFSSSMTAGVDGATITSPTANYFISGNPTQLMDVQTGDVEIGTPAFCHAEGLLIY